MLFGSDIRSGWKIDLVVVGGIDWLLPFLKMDGSIYPN